MDPVSGGAVKSGSADPVCLRLHRHYDEKYHGDGAPLSAIPLRRYPKDRYQAAVAWGGTGDRAMEIGSGWGVVPWVLRSSYREWVVTEFAGPRVAVLKDRFREDAGVRVLRHDIEREPLPFPENYFDTVFLIDVIEHLVDPLPAIREIHRVMRAGGRLLIDTPNIAKWTRRVKLLAGRFPSTASMDEGWVNYGGRTPTCLYDEGHLHYFTFRSLARLLMERIGFSRVIRMGYGPWGPLCRLWPTMFSDVFVAAVK